MAATSDWAWSPASPNRRRACSKAPAASVTCPLVDEYSAERERALGRTRSVAASSQHRLRFPEGARGGGVAAARGLVERLPNTKPHPRGVRLTGTRSAFGGRDGRKATADASGRRAWNRSVDGGLFVCADVRGSVARPLRQRDRVIAPRRAVAQPEQHVGAVAVEAKREEQPGGGRAAWRVAVVHDEDVSAVEAEPEKGLAAGGGRKHAEARRVDGKVAAQP